MTDIFGFLWKLYLFLVSKKPFIQRLINELNLLTYLTFKYDSFFLLVYISLLLLALHSFFITFKLYNFSILISEIIYKQKNNKIIFLNK